MDTLIESERLIRDNGTWQLTGPIIETDISSSLHGLNSSRVDRLEKETKRILQEASVIGRAFLYEILKRITQLQDRIDGGLNTLERLDLIRTGTIQPDLEYMFKHALTQESDQARDCFSRAVRIFEECESEVYLKQAKEALESR